MIQAPGSSPEMTYVDAPPTTVPPEASYEEDWEVFDPWVNTMIIKCLVLWPDPIEVNLQQDQTVDIGQWYPDQ